MRRRRALLAATLAALAALGSGASAGAQGGAASSAQRAFLVRGAAAAKGLPYFPPNALSALSGAYSLGGGAAGSAAQPEAAVWYTREALVLGAAWKREAFGGLTAYSLARPQGPVIVLKAPLYYLFFEPPPGSGAAGGIDPRLRAFMTAFERKFQAFFENAATDAELSFPAYVDY